MALKTAAQHINASAKPLSNVKSVLKVRDQTGSLVIRHNDQSADLCADEISSPTGNYSDDGCCPTFDCYKPCIDFLGVSHGSEYLNSFTYESGNATEESADAYGDYYYDANYTYDDYYNYTS